MMVLNRKAEAREAFLALYIFELDLGAKGILSSFKSVEEFKPWYSIIRYVIIQIFKAGSQDLNPVKHFRLRMSSWFEPGSGE